MLVTIKIHSAFSKFFPKSEFKADLKKYADIPFYLGSMHPRFSHYANAIEHGDCQEGYAILDKNLKLIKDQELFIKTVKQDDVFYLTPAIVGGGGKRGNMLLLLAAAIALPGVVSAATGGTFAGGYQTAAAVQGTTLTASGASSSAVALSQTLAINAGLAIVTSMFTSRGKIKETDQNIRQNDMFGALQNTIDSGTPIPLIYGMHRVPGQFISGYLDTVDHGKSDVITVQSRFES